MRHFDFIFLLYITARARAQSGSALLRGVLFPEVAQSILQAPLRSSLAASSRRQKERERTFATSPPPQRAVAGLRMRNISETDRSIELKVSGPIPSPFFLFLFFFFFNIVSARLECVCACVCVYTRRWNFVIPRLFFANNVILCANLSFCWDAVNRDTRVEKWNL